MSSWTRSSAGPDRPLNGDVWDAGGGPGGRAGGQHLRGDGSHRWRRAVWVQNLDALHPRAQRSVSSHTLLVFSFSHCKTEIKVKVCPPPPRWIGYSHVDFSGNQYILEKGFYNNCADWGSQDNRICSVQPILTVKTPVTRRTVHMVVPILYCYSRRFFSLTFRLMVQTRGKWMRWLCFLYSLWFRMKE